MDKVKSLTYMRCPHNGCRIEDHQKREMNRKAYERRAEGFGWVVTNPKAPRGKRSYHGSSLYVVGSKTSFGAIAVQFLEGKMDGNLQDVVNGMFAEPFANQTGEVPFRPESMATDKPLEASWLQLTVDVQGDHEWALVTRVDAIGNVTAIHAEKTHGWLEIRALQLRYEIPDHMVWADSGGGAAPRVYAACMDYGRPIALPGRNLPVHLGWSPCRGEPKLYFRDPLTQGGRALWHYIYVDPYAGHNMGIAGKIQVPLYEVATHGIKDVLDDLKNGRLKTAKFEVAHDLAGNVSKAELWRHLEGEIKAMVWTQHGMRPLWKQKSKKTPNHLLDCAVYAIAMQQHQKRIRSAIGQGGAANEAKRTIKVSR